ncbi:hypothetical protein ACF0H5_022593 [Mactra antiquata]
MRGISFAASSFFSLSRTRHKASTLRKCLILTTCIVQLLLCTGIGYALSVMYSELIIVFNVKRSDAALVQSLNMGMACGAGIFFTGQIKTYGPGVCIMVSGILCSLGLMLSPIDGQNLVLVIVCTGFITGSAMGVIYLASFVVVSWTFHDNPSVFLVCLMLGTSLGQSTLPVLFDILITQYSWYGTFVIIGALCLHLFPCGLFLHYSQCYFYSGTITPSVHGSKCAGQYTTLLADVIIWILLINYFCFAFSSNVEAWFIVDFMVSIGQTRKFGSLLASLIGLGSMFGRLTGAVLRFKCSEHPTTYHWVYLSVAMATLHSLIVHVDGYWSSIAVCVSQGVAIGATAALAPAIMYDVTGLARYPQGMALVNVMYGCAEGLGPIVGGSMKDIFGNYDSVFYMSSVEGNGGSRGTFGRTHHGDIQNDCQIVK